MKVSVGDVFCISTKKGFGFLQFIENTEFGDYVRILNNISTINSITQKEVDDIERWCITFVIKPATRKKIIQFVGNFNLPKDYKISNFSRSKHVVRGEELGWHIINRETLQRQLKNNLTDEDIRLSPHGFMNDTLIIEMLENDWKLSDWK